MLNGNECTTPKLILSKYLHWANMIFYIFYQFNFSFVLNEMNFYEMFRLVNISWKTNMYMYVYVNIKYM